MARQQQQDSGSSCRAADSAAYYTICVAAGYALWQYVNCWWFLPARQGLTLLLALVRELGVTGGVAGHHHYHNGGA
jgi:hypothetical protein